MAVTSTVGGVTSGYCATGSVNTATPPASMMTIDSTEAKIGRSMKKCEITVGRPPPGASGSPAWSGRLRAGSPRRIARTSSAARTPAQPPTTGPQADAPTPIRASRKPAADPEAAAEQAGADPPGRRGREQPRLAEPLDDVEEHRRQEDAEQRHAEHAAEHRRPQRAPHLGPGPRGDDQRHDAQDEGERGHQDRPQPQPRRLHASPRSAAGPRWCSCLANSTIRMAFLHARPTSTTRPICTKMLTDRVRAAARRPPSRAGTAARPG